MGIARLGDARTPEEKVVAACQDCGIRLSTLKGTVAVEPEKGLPETVPIAFPPTLYPLATSPLTTKLPVEEGETMGKQLAPEAIAD